MNKRQAGKGHSAKRIMALFVSFLPVIAIAYGVQRILDAMPSNDSNTWPRSGLFILSVLLTAFAYDTLKTLLTLPPQEFLQVWVKLKTMAYALLAYALAIVLLAITPFHVSSWADAFIYLALIGVALVAFGYAAKSFVDAVISVVRK